MDGNPGEKVQRGMVKGRERRREGKSRKNRESEAEEKRKRGESKGMEGHRRRSPAMD